MFFAVHLTSIIKQEEEEVCYLDHSNSCTPASNPVTPWPNLRAVLLLLPPSLPPSVALSTTAWPRPIVSET